MRISNANPNSISDDPVWYFLEEFSLSEFMPDQDIRDELTTGLLFQTVQFLGMPPECVENIEKALTGFVEDALLHFTHGKLQMSGCIRVFCQEKMLDLVNSTKSSRPNNTGQAIEPAPIICHSNQKINGGWGYFLIERRENLSASSSASSGDSIDLYLYKEGE